MKFILPKGWDKKEAGEGNLLTAFDKETANSLIIEEVRGMEATEEELLVAFAADPELSNVQEVFINGLPFIHYVSKSSDVRGFVSRTGYADRVLIFKFKPASDPAFTARAEQIMSTLSRMAKGSAKPEASKPTPKPVKPGAPTPAPTYGIRNWADLLKAAKSGSTQVYIGANMKRGLKQETVVFNTAVKIKSLNGTKFILDGNNKQDIRIEQNDGTAVTGTSEISGLKFVNGNAGTSNAVPGTGIGGAVYVNGNLDVTNSEFTGNTAVNGGAIAVTGELNLTDTVVSGNTVTYLNISKTGMGGGVYSESGDITVKGGSIDNNSGALLGGGISTVNGDITIDSGVITQNTAEYGGGIGSDYGTITLNGGTISNNDGGMGGGISGGDNEININGGNIINNTASGYGGGIEQLRGAVNITDGSISDNSNSGYGGGIAVIAGTANISGGDITGNSPSFGGGVVTLYGTANVSGDASITKNQAQNSGGGVFTGRFGITNVEGTQVLIYDNTAGIGGNEVYAPNKTIDPGTVDTTDPKDIGP